MLIHALPLFHTHGLFVALNLMLMNGGRMIFLPRFERGAVIGLLPRATVLMGVPTFYTRLLASPGLTREAAAGDAALRLGLGAAARRDPRRVRGADRPAHPRALRHDRDRDERLEPARRASGGPGRSGRRCRGSSCGSAAPDGPELPAGEVGVLEVRGPNVFAGYWRMPEKTAEEMRPDGCFVTGDLARIDADGYVTIVGRAKDLIITGGLNVYPKEVEQAIDALPGVVESAVIGVPHPDFGEAVVAVLTARGDPGDVAAALRERLAAFKLPKHVAVVDELPRNAMGKVQKNLLRERFAGLFAG